MRQQLVPFRSSVNITSAPVESGIATPMVPAAAPAGISPVTGAVCHSAPPPTAIHHLQSAWRVRQFAGSGYFGLVAIPRLMKPGEMAEVEQALARLGPFGRDRIDNHARLHAAIVSGNSASADAVLALVRHRIINPNQRGPDGDTLLHSVVEHGRLHQAEGMHDSTESPIGFAERLSQLINAGANPNATDREGRTSLERILSSERSDWHPVGKALLNATPRLLHLHKVKDGPTLLHRAARHGDVTFVERWLALGLPADIGESSSSNKADPDNRTPLRRALKNQTLEGLQIARMLLTDNVDPHRPSAWGGMSMLHRAAWDADIALIKGWIAAGLSLNNPIQQRSRLTALMLAVKLYPKRAELLALIASNCEIDTRDASGATAVHHAVSKPRLFSALEPLTDAGASLDIQTNSGKSPLEISIETAFNTNNDLAFWLLAARGADLDLANPRTGNTPRDLYNARSWRWDGVPLP